MITAASLRASFVPNMLQPGYVDNWDHLDPECVFIVTSRERSLYGTYTCDRGPSLRPDPPSKRKSAPEAYELSDASPQRELGHLMGSPTRRRGMPSACSRPYPSIMRCRMVPA